MEIWQLKIECISERSLEEASTKICDIQSTCNLKDLCDFILDSFDFDDGYMHEFFISKDSIQNKGNTIDNELTTLDDVFPIEQDNYLFMHFDSNDNWLFRINRNLKEVEFNKNITYPRIIEYIDKNPEQTSNV